MFTIQELKELIFLTEREISEMRDGWQLAGIGQADRLEILLTKLKGLQ